jgi:hypothetical protein
MAAVAQEQGGKKRKRIAVAGACLTTGRENCLQLLWRNYFELGISTVAGLFVGSPPAELRRMAETVSLHVIVCDFDHQLGSQWFPRQVLALTPAALATRHATDTLIAGISMLGPRLPRMTGERVFTVRLEEFCEFLAFPGAEARTNSDVLQSAGIVKEAQQQ